MEFDCWDGRRKKLGFFSSFLSVFRFYRGPSDWGGDPSYPYSEIRLFLPICPGGLAPLAYARPSLAAFEVVERE
jgi:hypothetical protein